MVTCRVAQLNRSWQMTMEDYSAKLQCSSACSKRLDLRRAPHHDPNLSRSSAARNKFSAEMRFLSCGNSLRADLTRASWSSPDIVWPSKRSASENLRRAGRYESRAASLRRLARVIISMKLSSFSEGPGWNPQRAAGSQQSRRLLNGAFILRLLEFVDVSDRIADCADQTLDVESGEHARNRPSSVVCRLNVCMLLSPSCCVIRRVINSEPVFFRLMRTWTAAGWECRRQVRLKRLVPRRPSCCSSEVACCTCDQTVTLDGSQLCGST
ncbi:hypothetical protein ACVILK_003178 [Bradyrhizobium embrapense]